MTLVDVFSQTERLDKITLSVEPVSHSIEVRYEDLDEEWFHELLLDDDKITPSVSTSQSHEGVQEVPKEPPICTCGGGLGHKPGCPGLAAESFHVDHRPSDASVERQKCRRCGVRWDGTGAEPSACHTVFGHEWYLDQRPNEANSDEQRGLYKKYVVYRTDPNKRAKHEHCDYFALDLTHDPNAFPALMAYASACQGQFPQLAADLRRRAVGEKSDELSREQRLDKAPAKGIESQASFDARIDDVVRKGAARLKKKLDEGSDWGDREALGRANVASWEKQWPTDAERRAWKDGYETGHSLGALGVEEERPDYPKDLVEAAHAWEVWIGQRHVDALAPAESALVAEIHAHRANRSDSANLDEFVASMKDHSGCEAPCSLACDIAARDAVEIQNRSETARPTVVEAIARHVQAAAEGVVPAGVALSRIANVIAGVTPTGSDKP